jgi:hypothetical protein
MSIHHTIRHVFAALVAALTVAACALPSEPEVVRDDTAGLRTPVSPIQPYEGPEAVYPAGYDVCPVTVAYEVPPNPGCPSIATYCSKPMCPTGREIVARLPGKPVPEWCFDMQIGDCTGTEAADYADATPSLLCCDAGAIDDPDDPNPSPICSGVSVAACGAAPNPCVFWECQPTGVGSERRCALATKQPYLPAGAGMSCSGRGFPVPVGSPVY